MWVTEVSQLWCEIQKPLKRALNKETFATQKDTAGRRYFVNCVCWPNDFSDLCVAQFMRMTRPYTHS